MTTPDFNINTDPSASKKNVAAASGSKARREAPADTQSPHRPTAPSPQPIPRSPHPNRRPEPKPKNPLIVVATWASSMLAAVLVCWLIISSSMFQNFRSQLAGEDPTTRQFGEAGSRGLNVAREVEAPAETRNSATADNPSGFPAPPNGIGEVKAPAETNPTTPPPHHPTSHQSPNSDDWIETEPKFKIPSFLTAPDTDSEKTRQPIWLAISQRDYDLAKQLYLEAKSDPATATYLTFSDLETHLKSLDSFWKSVDLGLNKTTVGTTFRLGDHVVECIAKDTKTITLQQNPTAPSQNPTKQFPTSKTAIPTQLAIALFRQQYPSTPAGATDPFAEYDFPQNRQLAAALATATKSPLAITPPPRVADNTPPREVEAPAETTSKPTPETRLSIPTSDVQRIALKEIKDLFKNQYSDRSGLGRSTLAKELLTVAPGTQKPASKYVLLTEAIDLATDAPDPDTALSAVDLIYESFQLDSLDLRLDTVYALAKKMPDPAAVSTLIDRCRPVIEDLIAADDYEPASSAAKKLYVIAKKGASPYTVESLSKLVDQLKDQQRAYVSIAPHLEKIKTAPDDPTANQALGEFYCFVKGDFDRGLPHLTRGNNEKAKNIALMELRSPSTTEEKLALADAWWDVASKLDDLGSQNVRQRAGAYYLKEVEHLTGIAKATVESRLKQLAQESKIPSKIPLEVQWVARWSTGGFVWDPIVFSKNGNWTASSSSGLVIKGDWSQKTDGLTQIVMRDSAGHRYTLSKTNHEVELRQFKGDKLQNKALLSQKK